MFVNDNCTVGVGVGVGVNRKRVLINASNLHVGGGVQVAVSFLMDIEKVLDDLPFDVVIWASSEVAGNLKEGGAAIVSDNRFSVVDTFGIRFLLSSLQFEMRNYDLVFTLFGPFYSVLFPERQVVGFAQAWILYSNKYVGLPLGYKDRAVLWLKYVAQWFFFKRARRLVVELAHVKDRLVCAKSVSSDRIVVVNNSVSSVYFDRDKWLPVPVLQKREGGVIRLGVVARDYPHKNLDFIRQLANELRMSSGLRFEFYVTLSDAEWTRRDDDFKRAVINVGSLSVVQCPSFYGSIDGVVFPSLLECFSATPLEAMVMKVPLFASDRRFVRDCCGQHAIYFDPLNAKAAAGIILKWFTLNDVKARRDWVNSAFQHVSSMPSSLDRTAAYINVISSCLD